MMIYYNLTGAARKDLVKKISELTGIKAVYKGVPSCAYQVGDYTITKDGSLSWPDLNDADLDFLSERELLIERLSEAGFEAEWPGYEEDNIDYSISLPLECVSVGNLTNLLDAKGELIKKALGVNDLRISIDEEKVTFPWFSELTPEELKTYAKFISALCEMSKKQKRISNKPAEAENEKYTFRCFLLRLGFIGDEYKADRKILLSNLEGSSAFRSGAKKGGEE